MPLHKEVFDLHWQLADLPKAKAKVIRSPMDPKSLDFLIHYQVFVFCELLASREAERLAHGIMGE
jgi:hypothetical protein